MLRFRDDVYASLPQGLVSGDDDDFDVELTVSSQSDRDQFGWVIGDGANSVRAMASLAERGIDPAVVDDQHGGVLPGPPRCGAASQELPAGSTGRCTGGARAAERLPVELLTLRGGASAWP